MIELEQQVLWDLTVVSRHIQTLHWNLEAEIFISLHPYLGEVYDSLVEYVDEAAEQIRFLCGYPQTTLKSALDNSRHHEMESMVTDCAMALTHALTEMCTLRATTNELITYADANKFWSVVDVFTNQVARYDKIIYFLSNSMAHGLKKAKEELKEAREVNLQKFYDDEQVVFGWASIAKNKDGSRPIDWQGDIVDAEDLEPAVYDYMLKYRVSNEMHVPGTVNGEVIESVMFTKEKMAAMGIPAGTVPEGWWVGYKIHDREAYMKVKTGIYKMFSIEGDAVRVPVKE